MDESNRAVVVREQERPLSVLEVVEHTKLVGDVMKQVMQIGQHYGVVPGCGDKPTLLKPGAEKLCLTFRLAPSYSAVESRDGIHLTIASTCTLIHQTSGRVMGSGMGSCSTREVKYAYRTGGRKCPKCGATAIKVSKFDPGGFYCFDKVGGCGSKFSETDPAIVSQTVGRIANEDVADQYNTVLKMANKRSLVAAVLNVTAASDIFTQDIEDLQNVIDAEFTKREDVKEEKPAPRPAPAKTASKPPPPPPREPGEDDEAEIPFDSLGDAPKQDLHAVRVVKTSRKEGNGARGAWTLFGLQVVDQAGGKPYWVNTFDKKFSELAEVASSGKLGCVIAYESDGKGNKLTHFEVTQ